MQEFIILQKLGGFHPLIIKGPAGGAEEPPVPPLPPPVDFIIFDMKMSVPKQSIWQQKKKSENKS